MSLISVIFTHFLAFICNSFINFFTEIKIGEMPNFIDSRKNRKVYEPNFFLSIKYNDISFLEN